MADLYSRTLATFVKEIGSKTIETERAKDLYEEDSLS